jgi:hypothetical protein
MKIDAAVATILAVGRAMAGAEAVEKSFWQTA